MLLYPTVSDYWNSLHQSRAIASYAGQVAGLDDELYEELWEQAAAYNESLLHKADRFKMTEEELTEYQSCLAVPGTNAIGYIEIDKIDCYLPIYHGTDESVLQVGVGHLEGSSLPTGGPGTHCVVSGHRGLPSARLFTDLDRLEVGDTFVLYVLDETLTYEVDQIRIVEPAEMSELAIVEGEDYCTLVTCTPYGINTHGGRCGARARRRHPDRTGGCSPAGGSAAAAPAVCRAAAHDPQTQNAPGPLREARRRTERKKRKTIPKG